MENASKALIMAAGLLMGVLILSLAVYLFSSFQATADDTYSKMREEEIAQINSFYLAYENKTSLTYYDIWNVVNKAYEDSKDYVITVKLDDRKITKDDIEIENKLFDVEHTVIYDDNKKLTTYTCNGVTVNNDTKLVEQINFKKNP